MEDKAKNNMIKALAIFSAFVTILLTLLFYFSDKRIKSLKQVERLYIVAQDSLRFERNKNNEQTATIEVLQAERNSAFTKLEIQDKDINRLQKVVKLYEKRTGDLNTAIVISNNTIINLRDSLKAIIIGYTYNTDTPTIKYPIYKRSFERKWDSGIVIMGADTLDLTIKNKNEYDITIGSEKISLFKKKLYGNITNLNPNTETTVMKVYQKTPEKTHIIRPLTVGSVVGLVVGYLIFK